MSDATPYPSSLYMLLQRAQRAGYGTSRVTLCEEAVRMADTHQDEDLGFYARSRLIESATFSGYPEKALAAFAWCLARCDRDPARFPIRSGASSLLWMYKWIPDKGAGFPGISRAQLEQTLEDLRARFRQLNLSQRPVLRAELLMRESFHDPIDRLLELREAFLAEPRDALSDCPACETQTSARTLALAGRIDEAWQEAQPLVRGEQGCANVPHITYGTLVMGLWDAGYFTEAAFCHERGYAMCKDRKLFVEEMALCAEYLALVDRIPEAVELIERFIGWTEGSYALGGVMRFYAAAGSVLACAVRESGDAPLGLSLGASVPDDLVRGPTSALVAWFDDQADAIAARYDARNGNHGASGALTLARARFGR